MEQGKVWRYGGAGKRFGATAAATRDMNKEPGKKNDGSLSYGFHGFPK